MNKQEIYLASFHGFYNTIWEPDIDSEIEYITEQRTELGRTDELDFIDYQFDYTAYYNQVGESYSKHWFEQLKPFISSLSFQEIDSPKEYNFRTDKIICNIELSEENKVKIRSYLLDNSTEFTDYIKTNHSSYDGFTSFYSNDSNEWLSSDDLFTDYIRISSLLNFILVNTVDNEDNDFEYEAYELSETHIYCTNIDELINQVDENCTDDIFAIEYCDNVLFTRWSNVDLSRIDYGYNANQLTLFRGLN